MRTIYIMKYTAEKNWCHLCGEQSEHFAHVEYDEKAERLRRGLPSRGKRFLRVCRQCVNKMNNAALNLTKEQREEIG